MSSQIVTIAGKSTRDELSVATIPVPGIDIILPAGYTSATTVEIGGRQLLLAYNRTVGHTNGYVLTGTTPWIELTRTGIDLVGGPWDSVQALALGWDHYLMAYRADEGRFGFFRLDADLSVSPPYVLQQLRNTPTVGFTTVATVASVGGLYVLGYNFDDGTVAAYSIATTTPPNGQVPPLIATNVWYHRWAPGWTRFAFFRLGGSNFFFKINTKKLNVNIDHLQDNPAAGTIEVGTALQRYLPEALAVDIVTALPWVYDEPYLLTYIAPSGSMAIFRIHADCLGWTRASNSTVMTDATLLIPYRLNGIVHALLYRG